MFYEQLLRQKIYADLTGALQRVSGIKIGHNFQLSVLVMLGIVSIVGQVEVEHQNKSCE
jgi:hypothetical protein